MKSTHVQICVVVGFGVLVLVGTVLSQSAPRVPKQPLTKHEPVQWPPADPLRTIGTLENKVKLRNADDPRQQAIAQFLRAQIDPESRGEAFKPVIEREKLRVWGWHQEIIAVEQVDGVEHVTVQTQPSVSLQSGGDIGITGAIRHVYAVKDNKLVLLRTETVGFPPSMFLD